MLLRDGQFYLPWDRQPEGPTPLDTQSELTDGFVLAWSANAPTLNAAKTAGMRRVSGGGPSFSLSAGGLGANGVGTGHYDAPDVSTGAIGTLLFVAQCTDSTGNHVLFNGPATSNWFGVSSGSWQGWNQSVSAVGAVLPNKVQTIVYVTGAVSDIYVDGIKRGTSTAKAMSFSGPELMTLGGGFKFKGNCLLALLWNRPLSPDEIAQVSSNPWQVYAPRPTGIYVRGAAAGGIPTLSLPTYTPGSLTSTGFRPRFPVTWA